MKTAGCWSNLIQWTAMHQDWRPLESLISNIQLSSKSTSRYIFIRETFFQTILNMESLSRGEFMMAISKCNNLSASRPNRILWKHLKLIF